MVKRREPLSDDQQLSASDYVGQPAGDAVSIADVADFDVFLSHNDRDKPVVERIAEQLRREGVRPFLDVWDLTPGGRWQRELADGLSRSRTCALFVGPHSFGAWQLEELELALVQANFRRGFRVFAVLLPGAEDPFDAQLLPPFLSTRTWVDLRGGTKSRPELRPMLNAIAGLPSGPPSPAKPIDDVVPYRGLETFEEQHAEFFYGRERDVQRLLEILKASPLLCVVGPSGSGKSSLVRAGLIPRLRDGALRDVEECKVCLLRPGAHPLQALATQLLALGTGSSMQATLDDLASDRRTLHLAVSLALGADSPRSRVVIVVDQLEEVFTLCRDERAREQFFASLLHAAFASKGQTLVVLTMRADFYARCAGYPELAQRTARSLALVGPMDTDELRQAIEQPSRRVGLFFEPGLVETILDDVGPETGALPLLGHALLEVWRRRIGDQLTLNGYVQAGRVEGALAQRAESVFSDFTRQQQQNARRMLLRLTQPGEGTEDTRRRATRHELVSAKDDDSFDIVLARLVDARLLTTGRDETGLEVVDISHEALIRGWPRMRGWIDGDRAGLLIHRRLTDAAHEWDTVDREPGSLYRGVRLAATREWAVSHAEDLSQLERDFLASSQEAERSELEVTKLRTRRLRVLASGLAVLTATVAVLAVWALGQRSTARSKASDATSLALASSALPLLGSRPDVSLLLAFEAYRIRPRSSEARGSVLVALTTVRDSGVLAIMHGHADAVFGMAFHPDGRMLASSGTDETVRLWDARTRKQIGKPLTGHTGPVNSLAFDPDGHTLASAGADETVLLWDMTTRKQIGTPLTGHTGPVNSVAFDPDGRMLASSGTDGTVRLWDARTRKRIGMPLTGHTGPVNSLAFDPDGHTLASAGADETVLLWDMTTRKQIGTPLIGHTGPVRGVAFGPGGHTLASASEDGTVRLWNVHTHKQIGAPLTGHTNSVMSVAFGRDGHTLASAGADATVRLWDMTTRKRIGTRLTGHTNSVNSVAFDHDGHTLASASRDRTVRLWKMTTRKRIGTRLTGHTNSVNSVAFDHDGRTLASASADAMVRLWGARTRKRIGTPLTGHTKSVNSVAFARDGRTLASAGADETVLLWDMTTRKQIGTSLTGHNTSVNSVAFDPDGQTLASAGDDRTVLLWDTTTRKQIGTLRTGHTSGIASLAFSPDGRTLACGAADATIELWDVTTHKQLGTPLIGHTSGVYGLAFSHSGRTLASASDDTTVRLWDARTRKRIGTPLFGHNGPVNSVTFSPDGRTLASAGLDRTVRLWDVTAHKPLGTPLFGHSGPVNSVAFDRDGHTLASASTDRTVRLWTGLSWSSFGDLQTKVCRLVGSGLNLREWNQYASGIPYRRSCP